MIAPKKKAGRKPTPEMVKRINNAMRLPNWHDHGLTIAKAIREPTASMLRDTSISIVTGNGVVYVLSDEDKIQVWHQMADALLESYGP